MPNINIG